MAETFNFTKQSLLDLTAAAAGKRYEVRDAKVPGLLLRVTDKGAKTFFFYKWTKSRPKRFLVGKFPAMTVDLARERARQLDGRIAAGEDPAAPISSGEGWTFAQLFDWWEKHHGVHKKTGDRDRDQYGLHLAALGRRKLVDIGKADIRSLHADLGRRAPVAANRVLALVRSVYNRAIADDVWAGANPAAGIKSFKEVPRERRLNLAEATALFTALLATDSQHLRDFIFLLLYTGARKGNVLAMRWDQLELDGKPPIWRIPETKNGLPVLIPLLDEELEILRRRKRAVSGPWVLPGRADGASGHLVEPKNGWYGVLKRAGLDGTDLRLHDLRRSLASFMIDTGASMEVIGKTLGHRSREATAIYARLSLEPIKEAKAKALAAMHAPTADDSTDRP